MRKAIKTLTKAAFDTRQVKEVRVGDGSAPDAKTIEVVCHSMVRDDDGKQSHAFGAAHMIDLAGTLLEASGMVAEDIQTYPGMGTSTLWLRDVRLAEAAEPDGTEPAETAAAPENATPDEASE